MFSELKLIVDMIRSAFGTLSEFKTGRERKKVILNILKTYFLLKDCVEDGEKLINEAGDNPFQKLKSLDPQEAIRVLSNWDILLRKQGFRLRRLEGYIFDQDHLAIISPKLQKEIGKVVGYKMDRVLTLHGIGSVLFLRNMIPIEETEEQKARLVALMTGAAGKVLNLKKAKSEIVALKTSLDQYRAVLESLISKDEFLTLSKKARRETLIEKSKGKSG